MTTNATTAPATLAVSLADAKDYLRIEQDDAAHDRTISRLIRTYSKDAQHNARRTLVHQGWRLTLDEFADALKLDFAPIVSVGSIRYYDETNTLQTLDPADYYLDNASAPGYVVPAPGRAWPTTFDRANAVMVDYTAGYGPDADSVPDEAQQYILAKVAVDFDPALAGKPIDTAALDSLLDTIRVYA